MAGAAPAEGTSMALGREREREREGSCCDFSMTYSTQQKILGPPSNMGVNHQKLGNAVQKFPKIEVTPSKMEGFTFENAGVAPKVKVLPWVLP